MAAMTNNPALTEQTAYRLALWARQAGLARKLAISLAVAAAVAGIATYAALTGAAPFGPDPRVVLILLVVDLILLLSLGALIARQLVRLWVERRSGSAGSRLHTRLVALFSLVAVAPAIITAVFSALFFHLGIQSWFSERVRTAVQESLAVANAYVAEHRNVIRAEVLAMANDINRAPAGMIRSQVRFNKMLQAQAALRSLSEATVFDSNGRILARTTLSLAAAFETVPVGAVDRAKNGQVVVFADDVEDQVHALVRLDRFLDAYLYVGRFRRAHGPEPCGADPRRGRPVRGARGRTLRLPGDIRPDLYRGCAVAARGGGLARPVLRQPVGPADQRARGGCRAGTTRGPVGASPGGRRR